MNDEVPRILENATVVLRMLPLVPEIALYLMSDNVPAQSLQQAEYIRLMQRPPYWAFCWGGGQALARWILDNRQNVAGRHVIDFGAGSGVAGIAAALAGAGSVLAVDIDPDSLQICMLNATRNNVELGVAEWFTPHSEQILLAADVGYEEEGFAAVVQHIQRGGQAVVAESRLRNLHLRFPVLSLKSRYHVRTFPDLDEASMFDEVHIYSTI